MTDLTAALFADRLLALQSDDELLVKDPEDLVNKGTGRMLRAAGNVDRSQLIAFLDKYAAIMPRVLLRYSIEKLDKDLRTYYLGIKKK